MPKDVDKGSLRFFYAPSLGICSFKKPVFSDKIVLRSFLAIAHYANT